MKSKQFRFWRILILGVIAFGFATHLAHAASNESIVAVNISQVEKVSMPKVVTVFGYVRADQEVHLSFNSSGRLEKKLYGNGDKVLKGEVVAELNSAESQATLRSLKAEQNLAEQTYRRVKRLVDTGAVSQEEVDQKQASLEKAKAAVEKQKVIMRNEQITAPFTGVLGSFNYDVGAYVSQGDDVVALTQQAPLKVNFSIPEDLKSQVKVGNPVTVDARAYPKNEFDGKVSYIAPTVESATGTLSMEASVENQDFKLSPGMFVTVKLQLSGDRSFLVIPDTALQMEQDGPYVYQVTKDHHVKKTKIDIGQVVGSYVQVNEGLKPGDSIVTTGGFKLHSGQKVKASNIPPPPADAIGHFDWQFLNNDSK